MSFKCSAATRDRLERLLHEGEYRSYSEVIEVAVENLTLIHEELQHSDHHDSSKVSRTNTSTLVHGERKTNEVSKNGSPRKSASGDLPIPRIFRRYAVDISEDDIGELHTDTQKESRYLPVDRWTFGQCNKILPVIANCRGLANLVAKEGRHDTSLEEAANVLSRKAAELGDYLREHDEEHELNRDSALSTAFPSTQPEKENSRRRYARHFIGALSKDDSVSGILWKLKLMGRGESSDQFALTSTGLKLASLPNPVLDNLQDEPTQKLSDEEREFLITHIASNVPEEKYAFLTLLRVIEKGMGRPNKIDSFLREQLTEHGESERVSDAHLSSQRSGAISRMEDLDLIQRVRDGVRIQYEVRPRGKEFLANSELSLAS